MARLCVVVAVLLMLSAFSLVTAQFQARQLFVLAEALHDAGKVVWRVADDAVDAVLLHGGHRL